MEPTIMRFAREAYARYTATTENKNYQGLPCPTFDDLTDQIKEAWCAAIKPLADLQPVANEAMFALKDVNQGLTFRPEDTMATAQRLCIALDLQWDEVKVR